MARSPVLRHLDRAADIAIALSSESLPWTRSGMDTGSHSNHVYADCVDLSAVENALSLSSSPSSRSTRTIYGVTTRPAPTRCCDVFAEPSLSFPHSCIA
jgi:hypothetical protein